MFKAAGRLNAVLRTFRSPTVAPGVNGGQRAMSTVTSASKQPLLLYTWGTPNGKKVSILLEELKAMYGLDYE